ncbi:PREDICTED: DNA ligase 1-like [Dinoponera quadriceps]|uniref:DNA ligase 1-like n=1 Tax=Dinoponera quadriceps TaxID=609295 RepID=A0A6P3Y032_DINQU|nr:PREDICTED: DNA ligase 1-like [Dinoponera quadriceps]XP_014483580.1 PREDICTED: DNA ligase 1-like [Dinoponera quadriceps]
MMSMKPSLYRVETYIVPEMNRFPVQKITALDDIDNIQLTACESRIVDENASEDNQEDSDDASSLFSNRGDVYDKQLEDEGFKYQNEEDNVCTRIEKYVDIRKVEYQTLIKSQDSFYPVRQFKRVNSLVSIDERSESSSNADSKLSDLCHHGYKNGCTATIPSPEEVSEEVFQENWLRKIETLRQREAVVTAKEMNLQNRERQLFRREREIRILERLLQDKLKQVEREREDLQNRRLKEVGRKLKSELRESQEKDHSLERGERTSVVHANEEPAKVSEKTRNAVPSVDSCERIKEAERKPRRSRNYSSRQLSSNKLNSYGSMRFKERPKVFNSDDLNSTLSADPGDSSFVKTSERFNPEAYKKPYAFTRSASERWSTQQSYAKVASKVQDDAEEKLQEEKVLRKLSENINATQDKNTKFQNYGLVDRRPNKVPVAMAPIPGIRNPANEEKFSYLDLATNKKPLSRRAKDRPVSWNEKTNEWLQKKRQAYNLAAKESADNKENLQCNTVAKQRTKDSKKTKNRIFTVFR